MRVRKLSESAAKSVSHWRSSWSLASTKTNWATAVHELAMMLHAGISVYLSRFSIELGGSMTPDTTKIEGNDIPERAGVSFRFGINIPL